MTEKRLKDLLKSCCQVAKQAGKRITAIYHDQGNDQLGITQKADNSPLTAADLASHHIITEALSQLTPEYPILSEESAVVDWTERSAWQRYWLIDPLDGTKEFIKGNGEFTVNIALIDQHKAILGVVYAPVLKHLYYAYCDGGAYKEDQYQMKTLLQVKAFNGKPVVVGSRSHGGERLQRFIRCLDKRFTGHDFLPMGSSLKCCLVAEGLADLYPRLGPTSEWDIAAAQVIVEEAGGTMTDVNLNPIRYNTKPSLLNPDFYVDNNDGFWHQMRR